MDPITILTLSFSIIVIIGWVVFTHNRLKDLEEYISEVDSDLDWVEDYLEKSTRPESVIHGN